MIFSTHEHFDNAAIANQHIDVRPLAAAMGAEIARRRLRERQRRAFAEIEAALFRHKMIYFRGQQRMTHGDQSAFSRRFGPFAEDAYTKGVPGFPEVQPLIKEADERTGISVRIGLAYRFRLPARAARDQPAAFDRDPAVRRRHDLGEQRARVSGVEPDDAGAAEGPQGAHVDGQRARIRACVCSTRGQPHRTARADQGDGRASRRSRAQGAGQLPPARAHPPAHRRTGALLRRDLCRRHRGARAEEAAPILEFLAEHITQPAFTCRLRWEVGMFVMWDNRLCVHQAFNDYDGYRRELYRTTVAGERPV